MPYLYTGAGKRVYMDYCDLATDQMLAAEPGGQYEMRVTDSRLPVPPADGYWEVIEPVGEAQTLEPAVPEVPPKGQRPARTSA
jgi:hypothetical protein